MQITPEELKEVIDMLEVRAARQISYVHRLEREANELKAETAKLIVKVGATNAAEYKPSKARRKIAHG